MLGHGPPGPLGRECGLVTEVVADAELAGAAWQLAARRTPQFRGR